MFSLNSSPSIWLTVFTVVASVAFGALLHAMWLRRAAHKRMAIPKEWPLSPRLLANSDERRIWDWLSKVFYNHHVMVKIPVTRFTLPRQPKEGQHLYNLLAGVYCTLTVCSSDGRVIGCVDVMGRNGISRSNSRLKRTLLTQCGMNYLVIEPGNLPATATIRTLFLGEKAGLNYINENERDEAMIAIARVKLSSALERQRRTRSTDRGRVKENSNNSPDSMFADDSDSSSSTGFGASTEFGNEWQKNSFLAPLDSRRGELHR